MYRLSQFLSDEAQADIAPKLIRLRVGLPLLDLPPLLAACPEILLEVVLPFALNNSCVPIRGAQFSSFY